METFLKKYWLILLVIVILFLFRNKILSFFNALQNQLHAGNIQPPVSLGAGGSSTSQTTISEQKASEYAARVYKDLGWFGRDNGVYTEMLALTPQDIVLVNNEFIKTYYGGKYKTIAEAIRSEASWLTSEQEKFLTRFDAVIK